RYPRAQPWPGGSAGVSSMKTHPAQYHLRMSKAPTDGTRIHTFEVHKGTLYFVAARWNGTAWVNDSGNPIKPVRWIELPCPINQFVKVSGYAETIINELIADTMEAYP